MIHSVSFAIGWTLMSIAWILFGLSQNKISKSKTGYFFVAAGLISMCATSFSGTYVKVVGPSIFVYSVFIISTIIIAIFLLIGAIRFGPAVKSEKKGKKER